MSVNQREWCYRQSDAAEAMALFMALRRRRLPFDENRLVNGMLCGLRDVRDRHRSSQKAHEVYQEALSCMKTLQHINPRPNLDCATYTTFFHLVPPRNTLELGKAFVMMQSEPNPIHLDLGACIALVTAAAGPKDLMTLIKYTNHAEVGSLRLNLMNSGDDERLVKYFQKLQGESLSLETNSEPRLDDERFSFHSIRAKHLKGRITRY